jgi:hypothetical protein
MEMKAVHLLDEQLGEVLMQDGRVISVPKEVLKMRSPRTLVVDVVRLWAIRSGLIMPSDEVASLGGQSVAA